MKKLTLALAATAFVAATSSQASAGFFDSFVGKALGSVADQAKSFGEKLTGKAQQAFGSAIRGIAHLKSHVGTLVKNVGGLGIGFLDKLSGAVDAGVKRALSSTLAFGKGLTNALFSGFRHFHERFAGFWKNIGAAGKGVFANVLKIGNNVIAKVRAIAAGKAKWAKGLFKKLTGGIGGLKAKAKGLAKLIRKKAEDAKTAFGTAMKGLMTKLATPPAGK